MQITDLKFPSKLLIEQGKSNLLSQLKVGQRLVAQVSANPGKNLVLLNIGNSKITASTTSAIPVGQKLSLEVSKTGDQPVLKILGSTSQAEILANALKTALPRQAPLPVLFNSLKKMGLDISSQLTPATSNLIKTILSHELSRKELRSPAALKKTVLQSGLLLEAKLSQGMPPEADMKANLLLLLAQLKSSHNTAQPSFMPDLTSRAEEALARINVHQLTSVKTEPDAPQTWQLEIPVRNQNQTDGFLLHIKREQDNQADSPDIWSIRLNFDLDPTGPVQANIQLKEDLVSCQFRVEQEPGSRLLSQQLPTFELALEKAGFRISNLTARHQPIEDPDRYPSNLPPLLDEKA